jgi:hypothetical protein
MIYTQYVRSSRMVFSLVSYPLLGSFQWDSLSSLIIEFLELLNCLINYFDILYLFG